MGAIVTMHPNSAINEREDFFFLQFKQRSYPLMIFTVNVLRYCRFCKMSDCVVHGHMNNHKQNERCKIYIQEMVKPRNIKG